MLVLRWPSSPSPCLQGSSFALGVWVGRSSGPMAAIAQSPGLQQEGPWYPGFQTSPLTCRPLIPAQMEPYPSPLQELGWGSPWFIHPVLSSFQHPFLIPLATKRDPSRSRAWQLSWERLIARKEGGAWREEEGKGCKPALRLGVGSGPSQRTHRGWGSSALQYGGAGQQGAALPLYPSQVSSLEPQTCFSHTRFVLMTHLR